MAIHPLPDIATDVEDRLVRAARGGDDQAFGKLIEPWRRPLFGYVYRIDLAGSRRPGPADGPSSPRNPAVSSSR